MKLLVPGAIQLLHDASRSEALNAETLQSQSPVAL